MTWETVLYVWLLLLTTTVLHLWYKVETTYHSLRIEYNAHLDASRLLVRQYWVATNVLLKTLLEIREGDKQ